MDTKSGAHFLQIQAQIEQVKNQFRSSEIDIDGMCNIATQEYENIRKNPKFQEVMDALDAIKPLQSMLEDKNLSPDLVNLIHQTSSMREDIEKLKHLHDIYQKYDTILKLFP